MENSNEKRVCPQCFNEFLPLRNSQIYDTANCRLKKNNHTNNTFRRKLSIVNKQLIKSYKSLEAVLGNENEAKINKHYLRGAGFSFKIFTNVVQQGNDIVYGLYDITFKKLNDEEYLIKRTK